VAYENSRLQTENTEILVKSDVLRAYQNYRDARTNYDAASSQLKAAQLSQQLEQERYRLGISDIVALTQANQNSVRAQGDFVSARYTLMFQKLLIGYASGTLNFEDIP
jgi:outer membrane protein